MAQSNIVNKKKRYGQYFSGRKVAELLVNLIPEDANIRTVIDPMVGAGDMLIAAREKYESATLFRGIDIDSKAIARSSITFAELYAEDAFSSNKVYIEGGWDLVITNPPYVRYQILSQNAGSELPTGEEVRKHLIKNIENNINLEKEYKDFYSVVAKRYSGLSDLAVPSWILCASLVAEGGYLAMVVPENWLNRDYATIVQYMLMKNFKILSISKDVDSCWFDEALVRTCLVVAQRTKMYGLNNKNCEKIRCNELSKELIGEQTLVDNLKFDDCEGYDALNNLISLECDYVSTGISSLWIKEQSMFPQVYEMRSSCDWITNSDKIDLNKDDILPVEIKKICSGNYLGDFVSLDDMGWHIGQGLRTGANDFFYLNIDAVKEEYVLLRSKDWAKTTFKASNDLVRPVVQNRKEISGLCINNSELTKGLLYIRHKARKCDLQKLSPLVRDNFSELDNEVATYIDLAEKYEPSNGKKRFKELSAVSPNEKKREDGYMSYWYMLPELKSRHFPDLCVPRINGKEIECLFVDNESKKRIVVDANFTTLWNGEAEEVYVAFAILNSTWFKCYMELIGTTMGGGALKVEASHIKKAVFPKLSAEQRKRLIDIGKRCVKQKAISKNDLAQIDGIMLSDFNQFEKVREELVGILKNKIMKRGSNK